MDNAAPYFIDAIHELSRQLLVRLSADLTALEALASAEEAVLDRKASAALFHHSAQQGCVQMQRYLAALHYLAHQRNEEGKKWLPRSHEEVYHGNTYGKFH